MKTKTRALAALLVMLFAAGCVFASCAKEPLPAPVSGSESKQESAPESKEESASESKDETSPESKEESEPESKEESAPESKEESAPESREESEPEPLESEPPEGYSLPPVEVLYCSFSEKPYFAMLGKCAEGATVYGRTDEGTVRAESWHGWFSLRLCCKGGSQKVRLWQTVGSESGEPLEYTARPRTPSAEMWPIVTGTGGYQFFFQKMLPDYEKTNLLSQRQFDSLVQSTKDRVASVHKYNPEAEVIYVLVPSAMSVYPEYVPEEYVSPEGESKLDLVIKALNEGGATAFDLKKLFSEHKDDEMPLYYHLDSHWADYGAYLAYVELFRHIAEKFPAAAPREQDDFEWVADFYESGDMTYYLEMSQKKCLEYCWFRKFKPYSGVSPQITAVPRYRRATSLTYSTEATAEMRFNNNDPSLPNVLVLRDSYSTQMFDLIADRSNESHFLGMWDSNWKRSVITTEKPDYVIIILAEWNLDSVLKG